MKKNLRHFGMVCVFGLFAATPGFAQEPGFFVKLDLGGTVVQDTHLRDFFGPVTPGSKVTFDPGYRVGLAAGYQFNDFIGLDLEVAGMENEIHSITSASRIHDATFSNVPFLVNVKVQFPSRCPLTPYIGAGVGVSEVILDASDITLANTPAPGTFTSFSGTDSDAVFAWQAMAGVRYRFNERMGLALEYRYFWADSPSWSFDFFIGPTPPPSDQLRFGQTKTHIVSLAFDLRF